MKKSIIGLMVVVLVGLQGTAVSARGWEVGIKGGIAEGTGEFQDSFQTAFIWGLYYEYLIKSGFSVQAKYQRHVHDVSSDFKRLIQIVKKNHYLDHPHFGS